MTGRTRAVFGDEAIARTVAAKLAEKGFDVDLRREPFAGEDDDEAHAWALSTDAPVIMLELLAEEYDGWVDFDEDTTTTMEPLDLPGMPQRRHRDI